MASFLRPILNKLIFNKRSLVLGSSITKTGTWQKADRVLNFRERFLFQGEKAFLFNFGDQVKFFLLTHKTKMCKCFQQTRKKHSLAF